MRVSTLSIYNLANRSMADANQALVRTQEQISTGKRILTAADDPVAATRIQQLNRNIASVEQFSRNIDIADNNLAVEETTLSGATTLLQRIQELAIQAGNTAVLSPSEYSSLADEVSIRLDELVGIANKKNSNGDYIFAGFKSDNQPFTGDSENGYQFNGDEGQLRIKIDNATTIASNDTAKAIFVDIPSDENNVTTSVNSSNRSMPSISVSVGNIVDQEVYDEFYPEDMIIQFNDDNPGKNFTVTERSSGKVIAADVTYTSGETLTYNGVELTITGNPASADTGAGLVGDQLFVDSANTQDVITTMLRFRDALNSYDGSPEGVARLENSVGSTINNLRNAQASISEVVSSIGARNNVLESTRNLHQDTNLVSKELLSNLSDLDFAEASTRLQLESFILQASQASFLRVSELSLINQL
jgi:flagellar hook-associated protein 3 FlgL